MTTVPFRSKTSAATLVARLTAKSGAPMSAMIEIADRCNEVCVHCYQVQGQKGEVSTDDWRRILDELAQMGVLFLTVSGGEATLRHDFLDIIAYARKLKFAVKLYTNGLTMTAELARALSRLAVQEVQISLYSVRAEVHDWVTGVPGSWQRTVAGVTHLVREGVHVVIKSPLMKLNVDEVGAYVELALGLGADYSVDPTLDPREDGDRTPEMFALSDDEYLRVMSDPKLSVIRSSDHEAPLDGSVCGACSGSVHVEANGEVRPCTQLSVGLGNALHDGVRNAWERGDEARAIRELTWGSIHGCRDCDLRAHCARCFATARNDGGDALGPYEDACRRARLNYQLMNASAPRIVAAPEIGRDGTLGPYRREAEHVYRCIEDRITDDDRAFAERHSWARARPAEHPGAAASGSLVQIRRPGAKHAKVSRVPDRSSSAPSVTRGALIGAVPDVTLAKA